LPRLHDPKILIVTALGLSGSGGKLFETETHFRRFDGEYRWFLSRACPLFDRIGNIFGWYGMTPISTTGSWRKRSCGKMKWSFPGYWDRRGMCSTRTGWHWNTLALL
jgi:hypothetical protein